MKILYSSSLNFTQSFISSDYLKMAKVSNFLAQKAGFETIFVGDDESINKYNSVPYNQVILFDDRIKQVPKSMWSAGKLIALSMMNEPIIHIDFDLLFLKKPDLSKFNQPIVCLHKEQNLNFVPLKENYEKISPSKIMNLETISYNSGLIGGTKIELIKKCANELIEFIIENNNKIDEIFEFLCQNKALLKNKYANIPAVLLEQIWLYQFFKIENEKISTYLNGDVCGNDNKHACELNINALDSGIIHFQSFKHSPATRYTINKLCEIFNI